MVGTSGWGEGADQRSYAFPLWLWSLSTFTLDPVGKGFAVDPAVQQLGSCSPVAVRAFDGVHSL